jgi:hypothetical protein
MQSSWHVASGRGAACSAGAQVDSVLLLPALCAACSSLFNYVLNNMLSNVARLHTHTTPSEQVGPQTLLSSRLLQAHQQGTSCQQGNQYCLGLTYQGLTAALLTMNLTLFSPRSAASCIPRCTCLCERVMPASTCSADGRERIRQKSEVCRTSSMLAEQMQ